MNTLFILALTILAAYFIKKVTGRIGIPIVTGYVIIGVILGTSSLKLITAHTLDHLNIVNDFSLGIIGFTIGTELRKDLFRRLGKSILMIAIFEAVSAFILVALFIYILDPSKLYQAFILGAVASATAPAATVYVIQQYKSKGPLSSSIMAVVGIDDAIALIIFVFAMVMAKGLMGAEHISVGSVLLAPVLEIAASVLSGAGLGAFFTILFRKVRYPDDLILGCAAFILFNLGIAEHFHLSGLLSVMAFGAFVTNMNPMLTNRSAKVLENLSPVLFACFFIFGGAHLDISLLPQVGLLGLVYLLARAAGKIGGATLGAVVGKAPAVVRKHIGFSLIPQVGVAIALAIMVNKEFGTGLYGEDGINLSVLVINILLFTTIITEIAGPLLTKHALTRSGERQDIQAE